MKKILSAVLTASLALSSVCLPMQLCAYDTAIQAFSADVTQESLADEIRTHFVNRDTSFQISMPYDMFSSWDDLEAILAIAVEDTPESRPYEGDYLVWHIGRSQYRLSYENGSCVITFTMEYDTTAEQEDELAAAIKDALDELDVYNASDYEKVKAVHDYIIDNVSYKLDSTDIVHTAYGALINGKAVCEGYSLLMYRMLSELGIDVRCIPGVTGGDHMWNLVNLYGKYYYIDVTYDDGVANMDRYAYFLKGSKDFDEFSDEEKHVFEAPTANNWLYGYYGDGDFLGQYNISPTAFDPSAPIVTTTTKATTTTTTIKVTTTTTKATTTTTKATTSTTKTTTKATTTKATASPTKTTTKTTAPPVITTKPVTTKPVVTDYNLGDVNGDDKVDAMDASIVLLTYTMLSTNQKSGLTPEQEKACDVNTDGRIDSSDASLILSYYAALSTGMIIDTPIDEYIQYIY